VLLTSVGFIRIALRVAWFIAAFVLVSIIALPHVLPPLGRTLMVVNQGNNLPSISNGSLLIVSEVDPVMVAIGDTVTFRTADGQLLIDQVAAITHDAGSGFTTKGYHRASTGPMSIPEAEIAGRVEVAVPAVGTAMMMLASTGGAVTALGIIGVLMLLIWLTEDAISTLRKSPGRPVAVVELAH